MSDETLVGLVAAGSDDAFAALDARYRRRLVRFAHGFVPGGTADAEDVVQDAMVRAVRALRNGSRPEAVGGWLHRITRNCALDLTASRRRHPVVELVDHAHPPTEDAQAAVERSLGVRGLVADVSQLPVTQRSALVLRELEGRSYADIADQLDTTVPAVKSLLVRARQGLKRARDERRAAAWLPLPLLGRLVERARLGLGARGRRRHAQGRLRGGRRRRLAADGLGQGPTRPAPARAPCAGGHRDRAAAQGQDGRRADRPDHRGHGLRRSRRRCPQARRRRLHRGHRHRAARPTVPTARSTAATRAAAVVGALRASDDGQEYGGCKQALTQASLRVDRH